MFSNIIKMLAPVHAAQRYDWTHDGYLHCLEARRGRGKSYSLADLTLNAMRLKVPVVTNSRSIDYYRLALMGCQRGYFQTLAEAITWLAANVRFADTWDDVILSHNCFVILDEATRSFGNRMGDRKAPEIVYEWFRQSRKVRCTVWLAVQSFEWLDKRIAQLVDLLWVVRREDVRRRRGDLRPPVPARFHVYGVDPGGAGKLDNISRGGADYVMTVPFALPVAQLYDSWELIAGLEGTPEFESVAEIEAYHVRRGVRFAIDRAQQLQREVARLTGTPTDAVASGGGTGWLVFS
jgi:hypothetical protein